MSSFIEELRNIEIFTALSDEQLQKISELVIKRFYTNGNIIFLAGEPGEGVFFLKSGRIKIIKNDREGREQILHFINPGETFGGVVPFGDNSYPATAAVTEPSEIHIIHNQDMEKLIIENPEIAVGLLKIMARRLRFSQQQINDLALKNTTSRMASMLLYLSAEHGTRTSRGTKINISLTKQELGKLIGTSRETANRILNKFEKQEVVEIHKKIIFILDKDKLKSWIME
ncbi:MAG: Crp/Fnr family transcriptional regulator [Clostridiales bacterium]|nr:Crp/Fnr family transcriptional regulator [Clostridiales bacterium]MCF8021490.1 Crp/Fnr family transcriptional regulator [Clostridiales bacterium]